MTRRVRVVVTGRVQGVGYRYSCAQEADRLGVSGSVRNRPDGSVEIHAEGPSDRIEALLDWCRIGPTGARVGGIDVAEAEPTGTTGFRITA